MKNPLMYTPQSRVSCFGAVLLVTRMDPEPSRVQPVEWRSRKQREPLHLLKAVILIFHVSLTSPDATKVLGCPVGER